MTTTFTTRDRCQAFIKEGARRADMVQRGEFHRGEHHKGAFGCDICRDLGIDPWGNGSLR